jgi:hypothetical protein
MQIQRCKALQILEVLGFNTMEKQPNKVLANRLLNIDSYITPDTVFTGDDLDLVDEMALAESITVTGEMGVVAPRRKKKKINVEIPKPQLEGLRQDHKPTSDAPNPTPPSAVPSSPPSNDRKTSSKRRGRQVGIGATIIEALKKGHYTKNELGTILAVKFPERSAKG